MSGKKGYQLLREESGPPRDGEGEGGQATEGDEESILPDTRVAAPAVAVLQPPAFRIRILDTSGQEHSVDVDSPSVSVSVLKAKIAEVSGVPPAQQRLIFCGKLLQDPQSLAACGIKPDNCVHLFKRPAHMPAPTGPPTIGSTAPRPPSSSSSPPAGPSTHLTGDHRHDTQLALYGDPDLMRAVQSVKLFSSCLVAICTMQLLLLLLRVMDAWQDDGTAGGSSTDDPVPSSPRSQTDQDVAAIFFLQVLLNSVGVYVGLMGARSAHTLQPQAARSYFLGLCMVGSLWIILRIVWAVRSVQAGYDTEVGPPPKPAAPETPTNPDGPSAPSDTLSRSQLVYMTSLSVLVYVGLWALCWLRASQFQRALARTNPPPLPT